jgi:TMEM199 family protein
MVLLTMTPSIVEGLQTLKLQTLNRGALQDQKSLVPQGDEPLLDDAAVGNPVSHSQIVDIWTALRDAGHQGYTLEMLLKGSRVYVPPPPQKPEPVS